MKRTSFEYMAMLFFKGDTLIETKIYNALRKKYKLSEKQLNDNVRIIYSDIMEKFIKDETERLKNNKAEVIEFDLSTSRLTSYINKAINSLKFLPITSTENIPEFNIPINQSIKNSVNERRKENPGKTLNDIFGDIADETGKTSETIKRLYYYPPKK